MKGRRGENPLLRKAVFLCRSNTLDFSRRGGYNTIMELKEELVLIDGNSLINRAYYALPLLTAKDGTPSNAVYGFAMMLVRMIDEYMPRYIAVAFDMRAKTFRHAMYDGYKATRKGMPDDLAAQMPVLKEMLTKMGITYIEREGIEADDIIGTLAKAYDVKTHILTGDRDSFQLIDRSTAVLFTKRGITDVDVMTEDSLKDRMGLTPAQIVDYKALAGDASDSIPGVPGIGDKRAMDLLGKYGSLTGIYEHIDEIGGKLRENLVGGRDIGMLSYELATIRTDCDVNIALHDLTYDYPFSAAVMEFFEKMEFRSLVRRSELFSASVEPVKSFIPAKVVELTSTDQLIIAIGQAKELAFAIHDDKFCFSTDGAVQYDLGIRRTLLDALPSENEIVDAIAPLLADESVKKYVYDAKKLKKYLGGFGATVVGYDDVALMEYLGGRQARAASSESYAESLGLATDNCAAALILGGRELTDALERQGMMRLYRELELPLVEVLLEMERTGFLLDLEMLAELKKKYDVLETECAERIYELAGQTFNINSPKQLGKVLFEDLGLPYPKRRGGISTSAEVLAHVVADHPVVPEVLRYRFITKLKSTYIEGLAKVAGEDGIVHTDFNQMQTATGRLSSSDPNLQNIPVREDEGKALRGLFVARKGHTLVAADYSQIELRVMAHLSGDAGLVKAYNEGVDIHTTVARELFGSDEPTSKERRMAKTVNFGIIYGMSAFGLSERLGISPKTARMFIDKYFERFPGVKTYLDSVVEQSKTDGYAVSMFGRKRVIPELKSRNFQQRSFGERAAMNMPLQSSAADIIKVAMLKVHSALKGMDAKLILQVHDELIVDAPDAEAEQVAVLLKREMENAVTLRIPLVADVKTGHSWLDCK